MSAKPGENVVLTRKERRFQSALAAILGGAAIGLLQFLPEAQSVIKARTHISIPPALFGIAEHVCKTNKGYRDIIIERDSDQFTFRCNDGMELKDTVVRIVGSGG